MQYVQVGQLELYLLDDGTWPFPARFFFRDVPETEWSRDLCLDEHGKIPVGHNYALLKTPHDLMLIDTGYGDETHDGLTGHLLEEIHATDYRCEDVTKVIITHPHSDHIKSNTLVQAGQRVPTFPHAQYYLSRADWEWFCAPERFEPGSDFDNHVRVLDQLGRLTLLEDQVVLTQEVSLLPTPGHTPGHTSVWIESQGQAVIFLGDLCHHTLQFAHPDWVTTFDSHPQWTPSSRKRLFRLALQHDAMLICPHAPAPGLGQLVHTTHGVVWQPLR